MPGPSPTDHALATTHPITPLHVIQLLVPSRPYNFNKCYNCPSSALPHRFSFFAFILSSVMQMSRLLTPLFSFVPPGIQKLVAGHTMQFERREIHESKRGQGNSCGG
ncbi:hypothetical protein E2C01_048488 [Portunus trituberculatus]|uniref:Uncharacterized protein n=1 Tax=Portunus trituberculatus TaxID=210409 RepID=A0A5B7GB18_PORTR|nr:hypothetical protein [Portunus trituberculatus]